MGWIMHAAHVRCLLVIIMVIDLYGILAVGMLYHRKARRTSQGERQQKRLPTPLLSRRALMSSVRSMKQLRAAPSRIVLVMIPNVRRQRPSGLPARERVDKQDLLRRVSCDAFVHC